MRVMAGIRHVGMHVRIATWNCKGGFRRKAHLIDALAPNVAVIPECSSADAQQAGLLPDAPTSSDWIGSNPRKGLAVFGYGQQTFERADFYDPELRLILPLWVRGPSNFLLIAIWTLDDGTSYIRELAQAVERWRPVLCDETVVLAGDFNASYKFDDIERPVKFRDVVARLEDVGITSTYHALRAEEHGQESEPTYYHYHHRDKPHHIDYVFTSADLLEETTSLSVGSFNDWSQYSDHVPLIAAFDENA